MHHPAGPELVDDEQRHRWEMLKRLIKYSSAGRSLVKLRISPRQNFFPRPYHGVRNRCVFTRFEKGASSFRLLSCGTNIEVRGADAYHRCPAFQQPQSNIAQPRTHRLELRIVKPATADEPVNFRMRTQHRSDAHVAAVAALLVEASGITSFGVKPEPVKNSAGPQEAAQEALRKISHNQE